MSFTSYLIRKFDHTHENQFFRSFSEELKARFGTKDGQHILIGNISVNGHSLDAIFLCKGQINVIDFKDYKGKLTFSENNPWLLETATGEQVYVQGGSRMKNPFQQVRAYKFSLKQFLNDNEGEIFDGLRSNISWDPIGSIVLFHNKVTYDETLIPDKVKRWFHITDKENVISLLLDKYSSHLDFTDGEIKNILKVLDVNPNNLLEKVSFTELQNNTVAIKASAEKLAFIKRLIGGANQGEPKYRRLLKYYRTLIQLERFKEPSATNLHLLPIDNTQDTCKYRVDISASNAFHQAWLQNKQERFPKNIFVGLEIVLNGISRPLLYTILLTADVISSKGLQVNFNDFELYTKELERMNLDEDVIEEISTGINSVKTLQEKLEVLKSVLSETINIGSRIYIGLSTESLFTAQLQSELNTLADKQDSPERGVFSSFLHQENRLDNAAPLALEPFIQISPLNQSQREAILQSFSQNITVITGPPGTGKSQVVANILANAAMSNHSVLFASRNNRAVDNVKDRLDEILGKGSVLRFGSKSDIQTTTKPNIVERLRKGGTGAYVDVSGELQSIKNSISEVNVRKATIEGYIARIPKLQEQLVEQQDKLDQALKEREIWIDSLDEDFRSLFIDKGLAFKIDQNEVTLIIKKLQAAGRGFISKLWFDLFHKNKTQSFTKGINNYLPEAIQYFVQQNAPWISIEQSIYQSLESNLTFLLKLYQEQSQILAKLNSHQDLIATIENKIVVTQKELDSLVSSKQNYLNELKEIDEKLPDLGKEGLKLKLADDLHHMDRNYVQNYVDFIPECPNNEAFRHASKKFLESFHIACVTSLSIKNSFPLSEEFFDLVVIDEASQCDLVSALPMLYRAKKAVIIGDPLQLTHITSVQNYEEEFVLESLGLLDLSKRYIDTSLYDYADALANKSKLNTVFLNEHYRCHPEIINFSNDYFYANRFKQRMKVMTHGEMFRFGKTGLNWIPVNAEMSIDKNLNVKEAEVCVALARDLRNKYPHASIGIVTPFKDQKQYIFEALRDLRESIKVDTVHQYQGDEKDIMILSLVVTDNSPTRKARFLNRNEFLINVAITRAKSSLYIVGNWKYCNTLGKNSREITPLRSLADYARSHNKVLVH